MNGPTTNRVSGGFFIALLMYSFLFCKFNFVFLFFSFFSYFFLFCLFKETPFSQLPVLFIDDLQLAQTHAIGRYLSKKFNLFGEDDLDALRIDQVLEALNDMLQSTSDWLFFEEDEKKKIEKKEKYFRNLIEKLKNLEKFLGHANYFLGSKISYADVAFFAGFEFIELIENGNPEVVVTMENTPKLKDLYYRVANEPAIAAWRNERPKTCF